ncbi:hybrid sensor histidine kinase/response regulator [Dyadobacter psychrotolerans]|uniref:histidine kinase n=1 Tax=Dyadobacter psychrotolerans TaxID=2541721 RepID=A0A4R5DAC3_9BACT|nr:ATP-binding protein [Dyadobacter psychrotolerans]TDE10566.1 response regulator [Dyadobacter psychrotolerans]
MLSALISRKFRGPLLSICLGLLLIFGSQYFAYQSVKHLASHNSQLNTTTRILHQTASFGQCAKDIQLNMHGYLNTDSLDLLKDNYTKRVQLIEISDTLFNLMKGDQRQTDRVRQLLEVSSKIALFSHSVMSTYNRAGIDSARNMIRKGEGIRLNQLLMNKIREIDRYENLNLENRRHLVVDTEKSTTLFIIGTGLAGFLLTLAALAFLAGDQKKQIKMQNEINKKEGVLKQYVEAVPDGLMVINTNKEIVLLNQSGKEMLGLKKGQYDRLDSLMENVKLVHPDDPGFAFETNSLPISRALTGEKLPGNKLNLLIDKKVKNLETSVSPIYETDGTVSSAITVIRDITERVNYETMLENARIIAEQSLKVKDIFLSNVSHEIRTPLNAIIGFTNLLEGEVKDPRNLEYVSYIQLAGRNLLDLINDILDFSKIEAGHIQIEKTTTSLRELIDSVSVLISQRAREKGIQYDVVLSKELPQIIQTDQLRLTQILLNVCGNAVKFTEKGSVTLSVEPISDIEDEFQTIRFSISDTGIGIQEGKIDEIFERFVQASESTTRLFGGTGLGLSIVKSLVTLLGGTIKVTSLPGKGTTFIIEFPFKVMATDSYEKVDEFASASLTPLPKLHVLVAEDNLLNQKLLRAIFERLGLEFTIANNGLEAVHLLEESLAYDLIIMDLQMPIMDGYTAIKKIRKDISTTIPIITMTAHALIGEKEECLSIGANSYISKPFKQKELISTIWQVTGKDATSTAVDLKTAEIKAPATPSSILNMSYLDEITGGSVELRDELISMFEHESEIQLSVISKAEKERDAESLIQAVHKYRSSLFSVGLLSTADKYKVIEGNLKSKVWPPDIETLVPELEKEARSGLSELILLKQ